LGYARAGALSASNYTPRYFLLAITLPCVVAFALELYGSERLLRFARPTLLVLAVALTVFSVQDAILYARNRCDALDAVLRDVRTGVPVRKVVDRHGAVLGIGYLPLGPEDLVQDMRDLRDAGHPGFQRLNDPAAGAAPSP
jgi:hypothetical protein